MKSFFESSDRLRRIPVLSIYYIVWSPAESLTKTEDTREITLSLREFKH